MLPTLKYTKDLFYIVPLLHKELPQDLEKLIMLDIDLEFKYDLERIVSKDSHFPCRTDIVDLYKHFNQFSTSEMIGEWEKNTTKI